jgi:hypothetical protein
MEANGYCGIRKKREKEASQRFEALRPLELAQMDILEFFINKQKVYLLLLDDFSRFMKPSRRIPRPVDGNECGAGGRGMQSPSFSFLRCPALWAE